MAATSQRTAEGLVTGAPLVRRRLGGMDRLALGLLAAGGLAVVTGLLPAAAAGATVTRLAPLLLFLAAVTVLAELTARAEVFDVLAARVTIAGRGSNRLLFLLCVGFAALTTVVLNLDTTAVLLTPVMLATAARAGIAPLPLAMTTVWLANTASLLLPVSNLTNLLAADRIGLGPLDFAARMLLPQLAALAVTAACLWLFYWRRNPGTYQPPAPHRPADRRLFIAGALSCAMFIASILAGVPLGAAAAVCALGLAAAYAAWGRHHLRWSLLPWRLVVFVTGLMLVVDTVSRHGLGAVTAALAGDGLGTAGTVRAAAAGGLLANLVNNLPAYTAAESVLTGRDPLLALLIGTNVGPLITPWASLATLLWLERCRAAGLTVRWPRFIFTGSVTAATSLLAATLSLSAAR
ncbi:SLC13 family permease [Catellatospora bangladeshensis]|uniref:Arsenic transporter n=1 Tax=Catellatospora bangladeshensis TaxID=310355 RepID=A0A8J3NNJ7_9ACTN|nr:SLC13 family permease [Catellatospora bangladeshensis]GIF86173.1 arsenic transporter [Catellatospora bangladeshensis]